MKKDFPSMAVQPLADAIQNTIRVFDEYRLDRGRFVNNTFKIHIATGEFLQYQIFVLPQGTQLSMTAGSRTYKMTEEKAVQLVSQFFYRLDQIANGQIVLTADVINRDVYKTGRNLVAGVSLLRLIVAIVAIVMALMALMHF